jgi:hypothetical protein
VSLGLVAWLVATLPGAAGRGFSQSDLDAFMAKVTAQRDLNWKKLQQYILDERERVELRGPAAVPIWGERREYTWFLRDGYFVRSPLKVNGVTVHDDDRRKYEDTFLSRVKARDARAKASGDKGNDPAAPERIPEDAPASVESFIAQSRQPQFVDSAYFLKFKFEQGKYALVGRETFEGRSVLRIEYFPERLFSHEQDAEARRRKEQRRDRGEDYEAAMERMMNKVSLVTIWVEPASHQIVKYTFDNVNLDFLPAAWLVRLDDLQATMTMSEPFRDKKDIWLPRDVDMFFGATLAVGSFSMRYHLDYVDYREATTSARIKGGSAR